MKKRCCPPVTRGRSNNSFWSEQAEEDLARLAKALGHPVRVRILRMLAQQAECICGKTGRLGYGVRDTFALHVWA
jgi:ArsR family transcriptional regulator